MELVTFSDLTPDQQKIVARAVGWDGETYHDVKNGIDIELHADDDGNTRYRVIDHNKPKAEEAKTTKPKKENVTQAGNE